MSVAATDEYSIPDGELWTIAVHDDQPIPDGKQHAPHLRVVVLLDGEHVGEFLYPSSRIRTLLAHRGAVIDDLRESLTETRREGGDQS